MGKLRSHLNNIVLSHSVFALPFAYMGAFLAAGGMPTWSQLWWITVAMIGARSAALALNNLIDMKYDKLHPRFTKRPLVTGELKAWDVVGFIGLSLGIFLFAAFQLHPACRVLWPVALLPLVVYPYMKRFSWTCHWVLGIALAMAPIGAWVAIRGEVALPVLLLGAAEGIWIGAFDVVYGCQDVDFDRAHQLHSMPVRFGVEGALRLSALMHGISILCFLAVGVLMHLHGLYYCGVILAAVVLIYQHRIVSAADLGAVTQAYFMRNGLVGIFLAGFTLADMMLL